MSRRTDRVAEQLRREIARILHEETTDPRIPVVTLTRINVAPDLGSAEVFWSPLVAVQSGEVEGIEAGLASAAPFVRRRLARVLPLKRTPELRFHYDPSIALGGETLDLLRDLADEGEA
jgi:ribosome-binding factor A